MNMRNPKIGITFDTHETIFTGRAGLVPIRDAILKMNLPKILNEACVGMWGEQRSENFGFESSGLLMFGILSGLCRAYQIVNSGEANFFSKLLNLENIPSQSSLSRFINSFQEENVKAFQNIVFRTGYNLDSVRSGGFRIIVQDQSAIQKYGKKMQGVEKGYGGTLKKGSLMLQSSLVVDGASSTILAGDIRSGSKHSAFEAAGQLDSVLTQIDSEKEKNLILADSGYGFGEYIRLIKKHKCNFILAIKHDAWLKKELAEADFRKYMKGHAGEDYAYREFIAHRKVWTDVAEEDLHDEGLRVVVVKLPTEKKDQPKFQYLVTNLNKKNNFTAEEVHQLYKQHRESIEIMNDELKNQVGLNDLPSQTMLGNRGMSQIVFLSWNIMRTVERIGLKKQRDKVNKLNEEKERQEKISEEKKRIKEKVQELKGRLQRYEWWTIFVRFITTG